MFTVPARGGTQINLTPSDRSTSARTSRASHYGASREPTWRPDGRRLAYAGTPICTISARGTDTWTMNRDGGAKVNLTRDAETDDRDPTFSPSGGRIAFASTRDGRPAGIWTMGAARLVGGTAANPNWGSAPRR